MNADEDLDDWVAGLSGKRPARDPHDLPVALRQALLKLEAEDQQAHPSDDKGLQRFLEEIHATDKKKESAPLGTPPHASNNVVEFPRTDPAKRFWQPRVWAVAASLAFVALMSGVMLRIGIIGPSEQMADLEQYRGAVGGLKLTSPNPDKTAEQIEAEFAKLGLKTKPLEKGATWVLAVKVSQEQRPAFNIWMKEHGSQAQAEGVYRITIETLAQ